MYSTKLPPTNSQSQAMQYDSHLSTTGSRFESTKIWSLHDFCIAKYKTVAFPYELNYQTEPISAKT